MTFQLALILAFSLVVMMTASSGFSISRDLDDTIAKLMETLDNDDGLHRLPKTNNKYVVINYGNNNTDNHINFGPETEDTMENDEPRRLPKTNQKFVLINHGNNNTNNHIHFGPEIEDQMERQQSCKEPSDCRDYGCHGNSVEACSLKGFCRCIM